MYFISQASRKTEKTKLYFSFVNLRYFSKFKFQEDFTFWWCKYYSTSCYFLKKKYYLAWEGSTFVNKAEKLWYHISIQTALLKKDSNKRPALTISTLFRKSMKPTVVALRADKCTEKWTAFKVLEDTLQIILNRAQRVKDGERRQLKGLKKSVSPWLWL